MEKTGCYENIALHFLSGKIDEKGEIRIMKIGVGIMHTQTKGCKFCLQIGTKAFYFGEGRKDGKSGAYLRLFTPLEFFKFTRAR